MNGCVFFNLVVARYMPFAQNKPSYIPLGGTSASGTRHLYWAQYHLLQSICRLIGISGFLATCPRCMCCVGWLGIRLRSPVIILCSHVLVLLLSTRQ
jgi:hypothetical protein